MDQSTEELNRRPADFVQFGVTFVGFVVGAAGMIVNSIPASLIGLALMAEGLLYFSLRRSDLD